MALPLTKASVSLAANGLTAPYRLVELGIAGAFVVRAFMAHGEVPWHKHMDQDESFLVWQGRIELESGPGQGSTFRIMLTAETLDPNPDR